MADQKRLELVLDPSKAQKGAKDAVAAVKSVGIQADITASKVGNISKAFDTVLAKLNAVNSKSPEQAFKKLNSTVSSTATISNELTSRFDKLINLLESLNKTTKGTTDSTNRYQKVLDSAKAKTEHLNSAIGKQIVLERDKHKEITRGILAQKNSVNAMTSAELAQKRLNDAYNKALTQYRELSDATRKSTIYLQESAKQQEMYQRALVDTLSSSQRARLAEQEYSNQLKNTIAKLAQYKSGVAQKTAEEQAALSVQERLARTQAELNQSYTKEYQDLLKANQALKERKRELLGLDSAVDDVTQSMSASERAAKKMADSLEFWEQRNKDLQSSEYKKLTTLRESARQLEAYEKSLVDALSPAQKLAKAENEMRKELERGRVQLEMFEKGLTQANIEQQEAISIKRQLAQSQARLNNAYSQEYEQLVRNNAMIRKRKRELEELQGFHQRTERMNIGSAAGMVGGILGAASGTFVAAELIRVADAYTNIQNRLAVVTDGTTDLAQATRELLDVSIRSRTSLDTTMDVYAKMIRVTKDMTFANEDLLRITETVSKAVAMSGASAQGAEGALLQFSQALSGDFQAAAQELNSIIEQTPAVAQLMADALNSVQPELNASVANLKRLATEGQISTEVLLRGILNVSSAIDDQFANSTGTVSQSLQALKDAFTVALGEVDKLYGGTQSLASEITDLAKNLESLKATLVGAASGAAVFAGLAGLAGILAIIGPLGIAIAGLIAGVSTLVGVFVAEQTQIKLNYEAADNYKSKLLQLQKAYETLIPAMRDYGKEQASLEFDRVSNELSEITVELMKVKSELDVAADQFRELERKGISADSYVGQEVLERYDSLNKKYQAGVKLVTQYNLALKALNEAMLGPVDLAGEFASRSDEANFSILKLSESLNKQAEAGKFASAELIERRFLMESMNKLQALGVHITDDMVASLVEQAVQLGRTASINASFEGIMKNLTSAMYAEAEATKLSTEQLAQKEYILAAIETATKRNITLTEENWRVIIEQAKAFGSLVKGLDTSSKSTRDWAAELESLRKSLDPVYAANIQFEESMKILNKTLDASDPLYKDLVKRLKEVRDAAIKANKPLDEQTALFEDALKSLKEEQRALNLTERELYILQSTQELYNQAKRDGEVVNEGYIRTLEDEAGKTYDLIKAKEEESRANQQRMQELERLRDTIADTFMDGFEAAMEGGEEFKDWFEDLLKQLALQAIRNAIVIPIVGQFLGMNGGPTGVAGMAQQGMSLMSGGGAGNILGFFNPSSGTTTATVNKYAASLGFGSVTGSAVYGAAGSSTISTAAGTSGMLISDLGAGQSAVITPATPLIQPGGYVSQGLNAVGPGLAAYGFGQQYGVAGGLAAGVGSAALAGGIGGAVAGTGFMAGASGALAGLGPVGWTMIGVGALLGGLDNKEPSNKEGRATYDLDTGKVSIGGQTGKKFSQENRDAAESLSEIIATNIIPTVESISGTDIGGEFIVGVGNRDPLRFHYRTEDSTRSGGSWDYGSGRNGSQGHSYDSRIFGDTRDTEEYIDNVTAFFATMEGLDVSVYQELADENELLIDSIKRVELQFSLVRGLFDDIGDSTEVTKQFADAWTDEFIKPLLDSGESLSEGLTRLVTQYSVVKSYTDLFGQSLGNTADGILVATDNIVKAAGGLEQFNAAASSYYQNFYSEEERFQQFATDLTNVFKDLGLELPTTTQGFRDLVEGLDLTKEADQELYATLLNLNPQVRQFIDGLNQVDTALESISEMKGRLMGVVSDVFSQFESLVNRQKDMITKEYNRRKTAIEAERDTFLDYYNQRSAVISDELRALDGLRQLIDNTRSTARGMIVEQNEFRLASRLSAQALIRNSVQSGVMPASDDLNSALNTLRQPSQQYFSTAEDYARDLLLTRYSLEDLADVGDNQLTTEEKSLKVQQEQLDAELRYYDNMLADLDKLYNYQIQYWDAQLAEQQRLYDLMQGLPTTIQDGTNALLLSLDALKTAMAGYTSVGDRYTNAQIKAVTSSIAAKNSSNGITDWDKTDREIGLLAISEGISVDRLAEALDKPVEFIRDRAEELNLPAFADGGVHTGGWRIVGEEGPELEYTPPSRIYSNSDSSDIFDMSEVVAEVRQLREDMRAANYAIAKNTQKTAKTLEKFDYDGLPEQRTV